MIDPDTADLPLGEAAFRRLRSDIVACRLTPGQRLTERGLAAELGMGVSPVRDALTDSTMRAWSGRSPARATRCRR